MRRSWRRLPEPAFASARIRPAKFSLHAKPSEERICRHEAVRLGKSEVIAPKLAPSLVQRQSQGAMHANRNRGAAESRQLNPTFQLGADGQSDLQVLWEDGERVFFPREAPRQPTAAALRRWSCCPPTSARRRRVSIASPTNMN